MPMLPSRIPFPINHPWRAALIAAMGLILAAPASQAALKTAPKAATTTTYRIVKTDEKAQVAALLQNAPTAAQYPNAAAITILDATDVQLKADGRSIERTHEILRVFNERGRDEGEITIPYNNSNQRLRGLVARTILPSGKVLTVKPEDVHESSPFAGFAMYDDSKVVSFSMPGVEDGAILDYSYAIEDVQPSMTGQYFENWTFASGQYPVKLSRIRITAPADMKIDTQIHNAPDLKPTVTEANGVKNYSWAMSELPDIDPEPMMPPVTSIVPWMQISTIGSWQDVSQWYWGLEKRPDEGHSGFASAGLGQDGGQDDSGRQSQGAVLLGAAERPLRGRRTRPVGLPAALGGVGL